MRSGTRAPRPSNSGSSTTGLREPSVPFVRSSTAMQIVIFGTGGVGGTFGGLLAAAGERVSFVARGDHLRALREEGLRLVRPEGDLHVEPVVASDRPEDLRPADVVLVATKSWQLDDAAPGLRALCGTDTFFVPLLNGVEAGSWLAERLGDGRVVPGSCKVIAYVEAPGTIRHLGATPSIVFGEPDDRRSDRVLRLLAAFERAGVRATVPRSIQRALWSKFLFVASVGGVGAVTRAPLGAVRRVPETRTLLERAMREIEALARARGVDLPENEVARAMGFVDVLPAAATASLQRDVAAGRRSELEAWSGAVVRLGLQSGVPTPVHDFLYRSLLPLELRARGQLEFEGEPALRE